MFKNICFSILLTFLVFPVIGQIFPKEGSKINFRIIGFYVTPVVYSGHYILEIARGNSSDELSFRKNIIKRIKCDSNNIIAEVPEFGQTYTWRILLNEKRAVAGIGVLHHFMTKKYPENGEKLRLRITKNAETFKDGYVFLDGFRALFDMEGNPVWFLPDDADNSCQGIRDMKITRQNTITFITDRSCAYEINYNADILWSGPDNGKNSANSNLNYHHEITRLANGHYMVLGNEQIKWGELAKPGSLKDTDSALNNKNIMLGTVVEYDEKGKLVWEWKSSDYFKQDSLYYYKSIGSDQNFDPHMNSFYFDEKERAVYASFKKISRIVKVKYPDGNVLNVFGDKYRNGLPDAGKQLFCSEHGIKKSQEGYLYFYNNNDCNYPDHPSVLILEEPSSQSDSFKKIWEYFCPVETDGNHREGKPPVNSYTSGGNAVELPDHSMLITLSSPFGFSPVSGLSIVSREKKVLWSAIPEKWNTDKQEWQSAPQYRASFISGRHQFEELLRSGKLFNKYIDL